MDGGQRDHIAAAAWHLGKAALRDPDQLAGLARATASHLGSENTVGTLRTLLLHPEPPGEWGRELHAKLDATVSALEVLHLRLAAAGVSDEAKWDALIDTLGVAIQHQRQSL